MKKSAWLYLFAVSLVLDLTGVGVQNEILVYISKPLLIITLSGYFISATSAIAGSLRKFIAVALIFSWLGDILLMFEEIDKNFFLSGLVAFLVAHIFYILYFNRVQSAENIKLKWPLIVVVLAYYGILMYILYPHLDEMKWAVRIYGFVISTMFLLALHMLFIKNRETGKTMMFGALLFVASDSILAINKFYQSFEYAGIIIMFTYGLAQLLITLGAVGYIRSANSS